MKRVRNHGGERGAALVFTLLMMLVLTLLSLTSFRTALQETKMAFADGSRRRALAAADSTIAFLRHDPGAFTLSEDLSTNPANDVDGRRGGMASVSGTTAGASYDVWFVGEYPPPEGSGYSARAFSAFHFGARVTGYSDSNAGVPSGASATVRVNGSFWKIGLKR